MEKFVRESIPKPNPPTLVNDFAKKLTPEQQQALEGKLVAYDDSTSTQIAIVTIESTGNFTIEEVALEILRQWGLEARQEKIMGL